MKSFDRKVLAGMAVTILALATVAPFAEAGTYRRRTSNSDYYRGPVVIQRSYPSGGRYYRSDRGWYEHGTPSVGPARAADWIFEKSKCDDRQEKGSEEQQKLDSKGEIMAEVFDRNNQHRPVP